MDDLIRRGDAIDLLKKWADGYAYIENETELAIEAFNDLPSAHPDDRLAKIADLVEGTIDHFDLDDAMDLLYQIKDVIGER